MKTKQELLDLVLTGLWHLFLIFVALALGAFLMGCASRAPVADTRTPEEKQRQQLEQINYQLRVIQMQTLIR